jgi:tetratricopeptide (TPR) repeat protein
MIRTQLPSYLRFAGILAVGFNLSLFVLPPLSEAQPSSRSKTGAERARIGQNKEKKGPEVSGRLNQQRSTEFQRSRVSLPQAVALSPSPVKRDLQVVQPPRSKDLYESTTGKEAEYERLVDEEIKALFKLARTNQRSKNRGEIWLRLGERYVEKARLTEFRAQAEYDRELKEYNERKTTRKPRLDQTLQTLQKTYNRKAVELYEWFVRDFPNDSKVDQALFFLGYNQFELGNTKAGERHYSDLVKRFPQSVYLNEAHFALGEYYFENEQWEQAYDNYTKVVKVKKARLNVFALYKSAWCLYRLGQVEAALKSLEKVVKLSRIAESQDTVSGRRAVNKVRLGTEAQKDYVPFFAEAGDPKKAAQEFLRISNDEKQVQSMLERLAYLYADQGNRSGANFVFKQLISRDPGAERSADYQYQVVLAYATFDQKEFRRELDIWLESFGPDSPWARENSANEKLVSDVFRLQETTVRNNVLQLHQTAQNSRAEYSQKAAQAAYEQYLKYFPNTPQIFEMQFFHAELLFDMRRHEEASQLYNWVAENDTSGQYREKSIVNALLALEEALPNVKAIEEKRGKSVAKMALDPAVTRFEKAALKYLQAFPKGERAGDIQRRLGVLYYSYNHFDEANAIFEKILQESPSSANAEIAGNLLLDSYKLRNDLAGFASKGQKILADPVLSGTKFASQVRIMMEKASYVSAEKVAESGNPAAAAKEFEAFAANFKQSDLAVAARLKAAQAYEKSGDLTSAIRLYGLVLSTQSMNPKITAATQSESRNALARLYQQTGQLELAAKQYQAYASSNLKDSKAVNGFYNAGLLFEALGLVSEALQSYKAYFDQSKSADRFEALLLQAELLSKVGQSTRASDMYQQYLTKARGGGRTIQAAFSLGQIATRSGQSSKARQWYQQAVDLYRKAGSQGRELGVRYAAQARFELAQETLSKLNSVKFTTVEKQQVEAALQVKSLREKYLNEMKEVIRFDNAPAIVAALASTGQMFESLAGSFAAIPAPAGYAPQEAANYKQAIQKESERFKNEAIQSYKAALARSYELEAYTLWTKVARTGLSALGVSEGADAGELKADARAVDWMGL